MKVLQHRPVDPLFLMFPTLDKMPKKKGSFMRRDFVFNAFYAADKHFELLGRFSDSIYLYEKFENLQNRPVFQRMREIEGFEDMVRQPGSMLCPKEWPEKARIAMGEFDYTPEEVLWAWPIAFDYGANENFRAKKSIDLETWTVHAYVTGIPMDYLQFHFKCTRGALEQDIANGLKYLQNFDLFERWAKGERTMTSPSSKYHPLAMSGALRNFPRLSTQDNIIPLNFTEP